MEATTKEYRILEKISLLSVINQIAKTIFVDKPEGEIEIDSVEKQESAIISISERIKYKLKPYRMIVKGSFDKSNIIISDSPTGNTISQNRCICESASCDINNIFISELKDFKNIQKFKFNYFNRNFFQKLLNRNSKKDLLKNILEISENCSWMIIPEFLSDIIEKSELFERNHTKSESIIYKFGKLSEVNVFINPDEKEANIYFGNYESLTILIDKNIKIDEIKSISNVYKIGQSVVIGYLFIEDGITKSLSLS